MGKRARHGNRSVLEGKAAAEDNFIGADVVWRNGRLDGKCSRSGTQCPERAAIRCADVGGADRLAVDGNRKSIVSGAAVVPDLNVAADSVADTGIPIDF